MNNFLTDIPGQKKAKDILYRFLDSDKIPHALLFSGLEGIGKDFTAIKFTQALNSTLQKSISNENIIRKIELLSEPYLKYIFPLPRGKNETDNSTPTEKLTSDDMEIIYEQLNHKILNPYHKISIPKANFIRINSIREIRKFLSLDYSELAYRVILISEAHLMNEEAQNALLKNLEEPPEHVIFILTTSQPSKLRTTIKSRCWRINFDPLSENELIFVLKKFFDIDEKLAESVAPFSDGSVQSALSLLEMDFVNLKEKTISILRYSLGKKFNSAFDEINTVLSGNSSENFQVLVKLIITWLNDLQKYRLQTDKIFFSDYEQTLEKFHSKFPDTELNEIVLKLDKLSALIRNNVQVPLLSANLVLELSSLTNKQ